VNRLYDIIVVGAGPGGSALAARLARAGLDVLLLDKQIFPRDKTCGDALTPEAVRILHRLGLAESLSQSAFRIDDICVTTPCGVQVKAPFSADGTPGCVIPRIKLDELLRGEAVAAGAEFVGDVRVSQVIEEEEKKVIGASRGSAPSWRGRVIVLAVGASVGLLKALKLLPRRPEFDYAARLYFDGISGLGNRIDVRLDGVPLPGYGWIFPLSHSSANVGVGLFGRSSHNSYEVLGRFLKHPPIAQLIGAGQPQGPPKSYPLRTDFHRSPLRRGRLLLIGEAAGLVNPFTGEGIDYALESAEYAAECLLDSFARGDFSEQALSQYDRRLRARFQRVFVFTSWMRRIYMTSPLLDALGRACARWPELTGLFAEILLTREDPRKAFGPKVVLRILRSLPAQA